MPSKVNETITMKVFPKGQVVIPVSLRKRYNIDIGDQVQAIPSNEGILLRQRRKRDLLQAEPTDCSVFSGVTRAQSGKPTKRL